MTPMLRTRWAALGAAVAITLGAGGGFGIARATITSGERAAFVPITPCRLFKTNAPTIGPRTTPLGADVTVTFQVTGKNGNCTIPAGATAVVITLVGLNQTLNTFLTAFPADVTRPEAATMNLAGTATGATSSLATIKLSATGALKLFNKNGTVNVIADITGYYEDHRHDDRYFTKNDVIAIARGAQWGEIPSGVTITGSYRFEDHASAASPFIRTIQLPGLVPAPGLSYLDVNFAADGSPNTIDDDASCTGSFGAPTAPSGKLCLYFGAGDGAFYMQGSVDEGDANRGTFQVWWESLASGNMSFLITYAYTAP